MKMNSNYGIDIKEDSERQIVSRVIKIKDSLSEADRLVRRMMKNWESEEAEMFYYAYNEFKGETERALENVSEGFEELKSSINTENNDILEDDIIS